MANANNSHNPNKTSKRNYKRDKLFMRPGEPLDRYGEPILPARDGEPVIPLDDPSVPTPEQRLRWRQMAAWEDATETVERRQFELTAAECNLRLAKKYLKDALAKEAKVRAALGSLSVLEGAC